MRLRFGGWLPAAVLLAGLMLILAACSAATTATPSESEAALESTAASESEAAEESEAAGGTVEITVSETSAGSALAGEGGMTLYIFDQDTGGESSCYEGCDTNWPPLLVEGGGEGVTGDIGVTARTDGTVQVTYNDSPLYYFAGDSAPGDATGDGVGGVWHIATP
jgi:predicted lipoprotein with Yx(FWY)xxD motif